MIIFLFYVLALEPRQVTRFEMGKFARDAYNVGIRYIGGCCAVLSYHIRAIAEEVRNLLIACVQPLWALGRRESEKVFHCPLLSLSYNILLALSPPQFP